MQGFFMKDYIEERALEIANYIIENKATVRQTAKQFGVKETQILPTNGSDEILNFAFMAFCDEKHPAVFPDITYGFYKVYAQLNGVPFTEIPLKEDFSIDHEDYCSKNKMVVIANPNAPTGICLPLSDIERILESHGAVYHGR